MSKVYYEMLSRRGHNVFFISTKYTQDDYFDNQLHLSDCSINKQHNDFISILRKYEITLMIYQDGINPKNNRFLRWAKDLDIKTIDVIHSTFKGMYGIDGRPQFSFLKLKVLRHICERIVFSYFIAKYRSLYREEFRLCERIVILSDKLRKDIEVFTGWSDFSKFKAITNPLTLDPILRDSDKKEKLVIHVGMLSPYKRQDLLLKIWAIVEKHCPDWRLNIVGDGIQMDFLVKLSKKLGLTSITFRGHQSPIEYYKKSSIFCLTSAFESFGLVLVESMALGCVPIAFNSFETACDIIDDGVNGFLISPYNIEKYAQCLIELIENDEKRKNMSLSAIRKSKQFKVDAIEEEWINLIRDIVNLNETKT